MNIYLVRHCLAEGQEPNANLTIKGREQAEQLANLLQNKKINSIICSPYARAKQSIQPFADQSKLTIEMDQRLIERILSPIPCTDWLPLLQKSFSDMDFCVEGGESNRTAMIRGISVIEDTMVNHRSAVLVTHGNLLTLMLHYFDSYYGYETWSQMTNPDLYKLTWEENKYLIERLWSEDK
ncbi:histidine phosphatase family protein [Risungbinella massiliensis]|uniref:histidine phosphatase family protein n=1 Tax=Risungbinella massiliensis TaxID=1329796 RepID=UPI0005CC0C54|nr:histidine phosphatase family protein [Risungbinella massiliensis]